MAGYDIELATNVADIGCTINCIGGAGSLEHIKDLFDKVGLVGAATEPFVFKGKYKAVSTTHLQLKKT